MKRKQPRRSARALEDAPRRDLYPEHRQCWHCGAPMEESYRSERSVVTLRGPVYVVSHAFHCPCPDCPGHQTHYRPEAEDLLALRGRTFGIDVVARIGELRFREERPFPEIHRQLQEEAPMAISEKEVELLADAFLALATTVARQDADLMATLQQQGKIVLALDGVQPEKGNETLSWLRDLLSGRVLTAANLLSSATGEIEKLLQEVIDLGIPIVGVVSDKQDSIVKAVQNKLKGVPHQLCQYHYLKDLSKPVIEADRTFKKDLRKQLRGLRAVERALEGPEGAALPPADRAVIGDYCLALRTVLTEEGKYPLDPPGVHLYEKLTAIRASIQRCIARRSSPLLLKLLALLAVVDRFRSEFKHLSHAFAWIYQIAHLLEAPLDTTPARAARRLGAFVQTLPRQVKKGPRFLQEVAAHFGKVTASFGAALFSYLEAPLLPRTNNELEMFIGQLKKFHRRITGRKNTDAFILRRGRAVAVLFSLPPEATSLSRLAAVPPEGFRSNLGALQQPSRYRKKWQIRRHLRRYLRGVEKHWEPASWAKAS